jgi:hypothetical protein
MTPAEIDAALPNGLHDASLRELSVDLARGDVVLRFDFHVGLPEAPTEAEREAHREGRLRFSGVSSLAIEPPAPGHGFARDGGAWVDGDFGAAPDEASPPDDGLVRLWIFVQDWNARIHVAARACALEWA